MALKSKTQPTPAEPAKPSTEQRSDRLPFLKAEEINGTATFLIQKVRAMHGKYGRSILLDGLADGDARTWSVRVDGSTLEHLIAKIAPGQSVELFTESFTNREGRTGLYIDVK